MLINHELIIFWGWDKEKSSQVIMSPLAHESLCDDENRLLLQTNFIILRWPQQMTLYSFETKAKASYNTTSTTKFLWMWAAQTCNCMEPLFKLMELNASLKLAWGTACAPSRRLWSCMHDLKQAWGTMKWGRIQLDRGKIHNIGSILHWNGNQYNTKHGILNI